MLNKVICLVVLGFLMAALCIIGATEGLIDYLRNPAPLKISLAQYSRTLPSNKWVELTGCNIAYSQAVAWRDSKTGEARDMSVPVYPRGTRSGPITLVLHIAPDHVSSFVGRGQIPDDPNGIVAGMVSTGYFGTGFGIDEKVNLPQSWAMADPYLVVNEGEMPSLTFVIEEFCAGLVLLACSASGVRAVNIYKAPKAADPFTSLLGADPAVALEEAFRNASAVNASQPSPWREADKNAPSAV